MTDNRARSVCVIAGVGPGNGAAYARHFHAAGYTVALLSRSTDYTRTLADGVDGMHAYRCDLTNADSISETFERIRTELGDPAVLLYNAGSGTWGRFDELDDDAFEVAWRINCLGLLRCVRQVADPMRAAGSGAIVVTGATASLRGKPFTVAFAQAKAAQRSLAQSFARQLGPDGIHVALLIIDGVIAIPGRSIGDREADELLVPEDVAATVFHVVTQPRSAWTFELDVRPYRENW